MRRIRMANLMPLLAAALLAGPLGAATASRTEPGLEDRVHAAICSSPWYGPFDLISFQVTGDTVML